jgi:hypothetical protein
MMFAKEMIKLLAEGKRVINIDESWLNDTNFARKKWKAHGTTNSVLGHQVNPRISMIGAVDTEGNAYISLLQTNNNNAIIKLFLSHLVGVLDKDDKDWRKNTVLLFDGAEYHTSSEVQDHLRRLGANYLFTGPRSYDAATCEPFWAYLKSRDLNLTNLATGKK